VAAPISLIEWYLNWYGAVQEGKVRQGHHEGGCDLALCQQGESAPRGAAGKGLLATAAWALGFKNFKTPSTHAHGAGMAPARACLQLRPFFFAVVWPHAAPCGPMQVRPVECIVRPGEVLFVPHGWWHCALNLETTIAGGQGGCPRISKDFKDF
jgi:hypothetical protein